MKKVILFSIILVTIFSCNSSIDDSLDLPQYHYFSGGYVLLSDSSKIDSVKFVDCATNVSYGVKNTKISRRIKRSYLMLTSTPKQPLFVEFLGERTKDSVTNLDVIEVDSLIGFNIEGRCTEEKLIVGVYESTAANGERTILRMKSNYTYTKDLFASDGTEVKSSGVWYKSAKLELILQDDSEEKSLLYFELIPAQSSLVENGGDKPLVYKKVYL